MAFNHATVVEVRAFGRTVGAVAAGSTRGYTFEYDPAWVRTGIQLAPVLMPTGGRQRLYTFPNLPEATFHLLPPMIADSLPDRFGNAIIDAWLATKAVAATEVTALDRLTYLGERGMGALEYHPVRSPDSTSVDGLDLAELVRTARDAVAGTLADEKESASALRQIISVGTSAGGARAKAVINYNPATHEVRAGHVAAPAGFEAWLLKLDGVGEDRQLGSTRNYGRIEYAYSLMAAAAGITMSPTRLLPENGRAHFMTRRFDRSDGGEKLHSQTLTGVAGVDFNAVGVNDYAQLLTTIDQLELGEPAREEAFRRMVFNIVAANCDDHAKNHGFLMDGTGAWSLAPAYDVTHAYNPDGQWTHQHLMGVNGRFRDITRDDLVEFGERHQVPRTAAIIGEVNGAVDSWPQFAAEAELSAEHTAAVAKDHTRIPAARGRSNSNRQLR